MALFPKLLTILFGPNWASWSLMAISTLALFLAAYPESITIIEDEYWQRTILQFVQFLLTMGIIRKNSLDSKKAEETQKKLEKTEELLEKEKEKEPKRRKQ